MTIPQTNWAARMAAARTAMRAALPDEGQVSDISAGPSSSSGPGWLQFVPSEVRGLVRSHLPAFLLDGSSGTANPFAPTVTAPPQPDIAAELLPKVRGSRFLTLSFTNAAGTRPYKLYVPGGYEGQPVPLIVMLHGCTQSPDDFAAACGMNTTAEEENCIVAYPGQPKSEHGQACWKWFSPQDQARDAGEPSIIAGITREIVRSYAIDAKRVFVAGFSAGGAMAAIMGEAYPDLYAAVGVHSGLACGSASSLPTALAAMKKGGGIHVRTRSEHVNHSVPTIVFHGDADQTVSLRNGDDIVARACGSKLWRNGSEVGQVPGRHGYTTTVYVEPTGRPVCEHWVIRGAGHAWSGGNGSGSFTDPSGPNATLEMMRFFREHPG